MKKKIKEVATDLKPQIFEPNSAKQIRTVTVNCDLTINMGNYSSLKFGGGVTVPITSTELELNEAVLKWQRVFAKVAIAVEEQLPKAKAQFRGELG